MENNMRIKIGINGFGRIGRIILRTCVKNEKIKVIAINDSIIDDEYICYLVKHDSSHGKYNGKVLLKDGALEVDDQTIHIFHESLPSNIPWDEIGVQFVIEASGLFTSTEKAAGHLKSGSKKKVLITAPSADAPMIILGVNTNYLRPDHNIISCGSSTLYCLAPIIKVLEDEFGIAEGFVTSIHAMTPSLKPLDGLCTRGKHWRDYRSINQNIIPAMTGACKALGKILPQVKDKMSGLAFRVPIPNVSLLDITVRLKEDTTLAEIVNCVNRAKHTYMQGIINVCNEQIVSSDFIGDSFSCTLDIGSSMQLRPNFFKLICWYENEYSYACRVIDTILYCSQLNNTKRSLFVSVPKSYYAADSADYNNSTRRHFKSGKICRLPNESNNPQIEEDKNEDNFVFQIWDELESRNGTVKDIDSTVENDESHFSRKEIMRIQEPVTKSHSLEKELCKTTNMMNMDVSKNICSNILKNINTQPHNNDINAKKNLFNGNLEKSHKNYYVEALEKYKRFQTNKKFVQQNNIKIKRSTVSNEKDFNESCFETTETNYINKYQNPVTPKTMTQLFHHKKYKDQVHIKIILNTVIDTCLNIIEKKHFSPKHIKISNVFMRNLGIPKLNQHMTNNIFNNTAITNHLANATRKDRKDFQTQELDIIKNMQPIKEDGDFKQFTLNESLATSRNTSTSAVRNIDKTEDIYEKLDSISDTDSNNSFRMNTRQSEVIKITDLTNSLEDLAQLDKICRIIEISDELSDKLFSVLDTCTSSQNRDRKWSFKKFCTKVNLDGFCDELFRQSNFKK